MHSTTGEAFDGEGRFWHCNSKLCPKCISDQSRRNRNELRRALDSTRLFVGEHWHFLTLTMPTQSLGLLEARSILNYTWSLFRKREWFKRTIRGGCKSEEFTLNKTGYNYHLHLIVGSKYIDYSEFRTEWTRCLRTAFERKQRSISIATSDSLAVANCQRIRSLDDAIKEVAKYITKTSTWKKIRTEDLLDVVRIRRFPRMFELFGCLRQIQPQNEQQEKKRVNKKTILDTKCISDGWSESGWRKRLNTHGAINYFDRLERQIIDQISFRMEQLKLRYPAAKFYTKKEQKKWSKEFFFDLLFAIQNKRAIEKKTVYIKRRFDSDLLTPI